MIRIPMMLTALLLASLTAAGAAQSPAKPNVVYILADDLGYGDVKCLNPDGKIATPNMDRLAAEGMAFTDAHGSSSVCTPTRYSILTGRYNWRSTLQSGVLTGYGKPLIKPDQLTVPAFLKRYGYHTACIGKWHLGMDMAPGGRSPDPAAGGAQWPVDFAKPIQNAPVTRGFDYFYGIAGSLDMPPFVYIENDHWTEIPTVEKKWIRKGPAAADFEAVDVLPTLTRKAVAYLGERAKAGAPFFLYLPLNSPHTPIVPSPEWQGKSGLNDYGDFVMETDRAIGEVLGALERDGLAANTLVIFTSDNGCSPSANFAQLRAKGHNPSYVFRGMKSDIWDGGHHIPFIARWPGKVAPGSKSDQVICLGDLLATCAEMLGAKLPGNAGEDSVSILPALLGKAQKPLREAIVHHSIEGRFAIRQGNWKLELCPGSGGWSQPGEAAATKQGLPAVQLYDVVADIGETHNVQAEHPEVVARLARLLEKYVSEGRSTTGAPETNDARVNIWKTKPNILFLFADDQRADTIAALGNPVIKTPNLDRLVRQGLTFNRAYMQGGMNAATCVPSRAMLLSGRSLFRVDEKLMRGETWPVAFARRCYTTFMTGKWHNGTDSLVRSFPNARSVFTGGMGNPLKLSLRDVAEGKLGTPQPAHKHACEVFADEAIRFLKAQAGGPFFCYVPFDAPHDPHIVPEDFPIRYDPGNIPLPPNFLPQHFWDNGEMTIRDEQLLPWPRPPGEVRSMIADYYRYISYLDAQIGRVLDALEASPLAQNTLVVFSADSGVARGSHGLIGKQNLYELDSIRVPLIISGPGIPAGKKTDAMCYLFDVLPTLGKLCGVPAPKTSEGIDFSATLGDPSTPARTELMFAYKNVQRAVRDERWKLIRYPLIDRTQLFDLQADPSEITNLATQPQYAAKVAELMALLKRQQQAFGDDAPLEVANPQPADWHPPTRKATAPKTGQ